MDSIQALGAQFAFMAPKGLPGSEESCKILTWPIKPHHTQPCDTNCAGRAASARKTTSIARNLRTQLMEFSTKTLSPKPQTFSRQSGMEVTSMVLMRSVREHKPSCGASTRAETAAEISKGPDPCDVFRILPKPDYRVKTAWNHWSHVAESSKEQGLSAWQSLYAVAVAVAVAGVVVTKRVQAVLYKVQKELSA